jgi:hypothetical protein
VINFHGVAPAAGGHDQDCPGGDRPEFETDESLHFLAIKLLENHPSAKLTLAFKYPGNDRHETLMKKPKPQVPKLTGGCLDSPGYLARARTEMAVHSH